MTRLWVWLLDCLNRRGKGLACQLVYWTGKASAPIHPKHLVEMPWHAWYLDSIGSNDVVLDVGCGTGTHAKRVLHRTGAIVAAVDRDAQAFPDAGEVGIYFCQGDASQKIPWPDGFFTRVLAFDVIEHVDDRQRLLWEICRVLAPGGLLLIAAPNRASSWRRRLREAGLFAYSDLDHRLEYTLPEFLDELRRGGFVPIGLPEPTVYDTPWAGVIDLVGGLSLPLYRRLCLWKRRRAVRRPEEATGFCVVAGMA